MEAETFVPLSKREQEVLYRIAEGDSSKEIGERLCISENTVKVHISNIQNKLNARNRVHVVRRAFHFGLLKP